MIDIPLGKALVPVELNPVDYNKRHSMCALSSYKDTDCRFYCVGQGRKDGKYVIFKLVDYSVEEKE